MKVYVAMISRPDVHTIIGVYSSLPKAERARTVADEIEGPTRANCIYECNLDGSNDWRHIRPSKVLQPVK